RGGKGPPRTQALAKSRDCRSHRGRPGGTKPRGSGSVWTAECPKAGAAAHANGHFIMTIKHIALAGAAALAILAFPLSASAQGVPRGAAEGARVGNQAAGPVGGAAGAVVGGVAGGVVGGVKGIVGIPQKTGIPHRNRNQRRHYRR